MLALLRRAVPWAAALLLPATAATAQQAGARAGLTPPNTAAVSPWRQDADNDALQRGLEFTVPGVDELADFHGSLDDPKLVLFVGGNYFFAMVPLVRAFERLHPQYRGGIYWETLPPGLLARQIRAAGTVTCGNMTWTVKADAYFAGLAAVKQLIGEGLLIGPAVPYVTNTLTIMVPRGNPAHIAGLADLARPGLSIAMPNPAFEGIARQIKAALARAGGEALVAAVYGRKVEAGTTLLTQIHHRQTPLLLMRGRAGAGVTWKSEAIYQEEAGHPIGHIDIPAAENSTGVYAGAVVRSAPHPEAARAWLAFIRSPEALRIFEHYGFRPYQGGGD